MQSASHCKRIIWARWQPARFESSLSKLVFRKEAKCRISRARETEPAEKSSQQQKHQTFLGTPHNAFRKYFDIKPSMNWKTWPASTKGAICFGGCHPQAPITITCCFEIFWSSGHMLHANAMKNKLQQCPCLAASLSHSTIEALPFHDVHRGSNAHTFTSVLLCFQCRSNFRINPLNIKVRAVWYTLPAQRNT